MTVEYGTHRDIDTWMALVRAIRWNFPGLETEEALEDHRQTVLRFMRDNRALCVKAEGNVVGVLLFSRKRNMICCLGVLPACRRQGVASQLLREALRSLDRARDITVTTFRAEDEKGTAPRPFYMRFGFRPGREFEELGYPVQEFVLPAGKE